MHMRPKLCSFILFISLLSAAVSESRGCKRLGLGPNQNAPGGESYTRLCIADWALNRTYTAATSAPMATALRSHPDSAKTVEALFTLLDYAEDEYQRLRGINKGRRNLERIPNERKCNIEQPGNKNKEMTDSVERQISEYGWGLIKGPCISQLEPEVNSTTVGAMKTYLSNLNKVTKDAVRNANLPWPNATTYIHSQYSGTHDSCDLWHLGGFRVNGSWSINTGITNDRTSKTFPDFQRHYFVENLRLNANGQIEPRLMKQRIMAPDVANYTTGDDMISQWERRSTSTMNTWGGIPATSLFTGLFGTGNNPAIQTALLQDSATLEQIEDATTVSGIAILVIPVLLTMVPIALFADIDTSATLVYTLVTDILTVMPLAVKGIELLQYSTQRHEASRNWIYASELLDEESPAAIEMWHARCGANSWIARIGAIFVASATVFMIAGIVLEFVAKWHVEKRKEQVKKSKDPEGGLFKNSTHKRNSLWKKRSECGECECRTQQTPRPPHSLRVE